MKDLFQKQLMDTFSEKLLQKFGCYCEMQGVTPSNELLLTYLIDRSLIAPIKLQNFAIIETYESLRHANGMTKTQTIELLASRFNLSSRSIWNILSKHQNGKKR